MRAPGRHTARRKGINARLATAGHADYAHGPRRQTPTSTAQAPASGPQTQRGRNRPGTAAAGAVGLRSVTMTPANPAASLQVKAQGGALSARIGPPNAGGVWPPMGAFPGPYVYDAQSARRIPAVGRALQLYAGLVKQMPMEAYRGFQRLPQPRLLSKPDPLRGGPEFVGLSIEDYLLSGNAIALVTARGADGWPLACTWLPTQWVYIQWDVTQPLPSYYYINRPLPFDDVIHVRRSADRYYPVRGVGVVEEHLGSLDRIAMEEEYERNALSDGAVPSVAVITPTSTLTQDTADEAKANWQAKFSGPTREPVFLPNGTTVVPLAWSPTDTQLQAARQMSLHRRGEHV